jgi:PEP-CTERM motif
MIRISTRKTILTASIIAGFVCALGSRPVRADSLTGTEMVLEEAYPAINHINYTWGPFVVGNNPAVTVLDVPGLVPFVLDAYDSSATFHFPDSAQASGGSFNGYILVDNAVTFTGVSVDPSTTLEGFNDSRLSFDSNHIYINNENLFITAGSTLTVDISSVPEPSSLFLAVLGCGLVSVWGKRRHPRRA